MRRLSWAVVAGLWLAAMPAWAEGAPPPKRQPMFGAGFDVGVPDFIGVNIFVRPIRMLRLQAGPLYNIAGWGIRGGATFVPFDFVISPTLTFEVGHYFSGDANRVAGLFGAGPLDGDLGAALSNFRYTFGNLHLGLEIGSSRSVMFTLHFGLSYVVLTAPNLGQTLQNASGDPTLELKDPLIRFIAPSAKLGLMVFFG